MPFEKGKACHTDGRRLQAAIQRSARAEAQKSITALATIRDDPKARTELRAQAALKLLDLGKWNGRHQPAAMAAH